MNIKHGFGLFLECDFKYRTLLAEISLGYLKPVSSVHHSWTMDFKTNNQFFLNNEYNNEMDHPYLIKLEISQANIPNFPDSTDFL